MTNLTDKWKKGELSSGWYYVKNDFGNIFPSEYSETYDSINDRVIKDFFTEVSDIKEILEPVPSYEQWENLKSKLQLKETAYDFDTARLEEENTKLKELLKEAYPVIEFGDGAMMSKWEANWLAKAKEILGDK